MGMWRQKGGERIAVSDMDASHLQNAHRMMCKRLDIAKGKYDWLTVQGLPMYHRGMFWCWWGWIYLLEFELKKRGLNLLAEGFEAYHFLDAAEPYMYKNDGGEWVFTRLVEDDTGEAVHRLDDETILGIYTRFKEAREVSLSYLSCPLPNGDAAMDAFDMEFQYALQFEVEATNGLPVIQYEVDRRGLPTGEEARE